MNAKIETCSPTLFQKQGKDDYGGDVYLYNFITVLWSIGLESQHFLPTVPYLLLLSFFLKKYSTLFVM